MAAASLLQQLRCGLRSFGGHTPPWEEVRGLLLCDEDRPAFWERFAEEQPQLLIDHVFSYLRRELLKGTQNSDSSGRVTK